MTAPPIAWIRQQPVMNTSNTESIPSIAVDSARNTYIAYVTDGTVIGQTAIGTNDIDIVVSKIDTNGNVMWTKQHLATVGNENIPSIAVDSAGNTYVAYITTGTVSGGTRVGDGDIVVLKMDTNGNVTWVKQQTVMNSSTLDTSPSIAVDSNNNIYVAYHTFGTVSGGTNASSNPDIVVFKMDTDGNVTWIKQQTVMNTSTSDTDPSIAVDSNNNIYVAYQTAGTVSGGTTASNRDIVVFKLDTNGNVTWIKQQTAMNTSGSDTVPSIAVDSVGNTYVAYNTGGTVSGGTTAGGNDIVVFKLDTNGNVTWIKQQTAMNTSGSDTVPSIAVDSVGNTYVAYQTSGTVIGGTNNANSNDIVVFKMDTNGNVTWISQQTATNTSLSDQNPSIAVDSNNNIYVAYQTTGTVSDGTTAGNADIVVFKLVSPPAAPAITANPTIVTPTSIRYNWTALPSTTYTIRLTDGTSPSSLSADNATFTNLTTGTPYTATIYATDSYNQIGPTSTYTTVPLGILPLAPIVRRTPQVSPTAVSYYWTPLPTISSYTVTLTGTGSGTGSQQLPSLSRSCTFINLTPAETYAATIYATDYFNQIGSVASYNTIQPCNRPGPPTNVNFAASNGTLTVTWSPPVDDGIPIRGYVIRDTNRTRALTFGVRASSRQYTVAIPSGTYKFQIAALNFAGHGTPVVSGQLTF